MMNLVTSAVGLLLLLAFLGVMVWWVKEIPLIIIVALVVGLLLRDLVSSLRGGNGA
jgi:hypothetical protein